MTRREPADIGMVGLGVVGKNLALNMNDYGHEVAVHDRSKDVMDVWLLA